MPAIGSLPMALSEIKTEFAGPNTMSSYLRGGAYVPNITANNAVATALPLTMSTFVGAVNRTFGLTLGDQYTSNPFGSSTTTVTIGSNGSPWTLPIETGVGAGYEVRLTKNSGDTITGNAQGSWLALSSNREWSVIALLGESRTANVTIEIRITSGATVASETLNMTAEGL